MKALYLKLKTPPAHIPTAAELYEYKELFDFADDNHDGKLNFHKIQKMLQTFGEKVNDTEVANWVGDSDSNKD
jgi:Ca2+-binding EF-hand superfamily protein